MTERRHSLKCSGFGSKTGMMTDIFCRLRGRWHILGDDPAIFYEAPKGFSWRNYINLCYTLSKYQERWRETSSLESIRQPSPPVGEATVLKLDTICSYEKNIHFGIGLYRTPRQNLRPSLRRDTG